MATRFIQGNVSSPAIPVGMVQAFAGTVVPSGWLACDGTQVSRTTYAALFAAIGTTHGNGNGTTTFHLPDYRGRMLRGGDSMFGGVAAGRDPDSASRTQMNAGGNAGNAVGSVQGQATAKNGLANAASAVTGTTNIGHTHAASSVTGITGSNSASGISGTAVGGVNLTHGHTMYARRMTQGTTQTSNNEVSVTGGASYGDQWWGVDNSGTLDHSHGLSGTAAAQSWSQTGSGSAAGQTLGSTLIALASGSAAAQTMTGDAETRPINAYVNYIIKV